MLSFARLSNRPSAVQRLMSVFLTHKDSHISYIGFAPKSSQNKKRHVAKTRNVRNLSAPNKRTILESKLLFYHCYYILLLYALTTLV
jgi:DNA primase